MTIREFQRMQQAGRHHDRAVPQTVGVRAGSVDQYGSSGQMFGRWLIKADCGDEAIGDAAHPCSIGFARCASDERTMRP
jgi:hypothetical protein